MTEGVAAAVERAKVVAGDKAGVLAGTPIDSAGAAVRSTKRRRRPAIVEAVGTGCLAEKV